MLHPSLALVLLIALGSQVDAVGRPWVKRASPPHFGSPDQAEGEEDGQVLHQMTYLLPGGGQITTFDPPAGGHRRQPNQFFPGAGSLHGKSPQYHEQRFNHAGRSAHRNFDSCHFQPGMNGSPKFPGAYGGLQPSQCRDKDWSNRWRSPSPRLDQPHFAPMCSTTERYPPPFSTVSPEVCHAEFFEVPSNPRSGSFPPDGKQSSQFPSCYGPVASTSRPNCPSEWDSRSPPRRGCTDARPPFPTTTPKPSCLSNFFHDFMPKYVETVPPATCPISPLYQPPEPSPCSSSRYRSSSNEPQSRRQYK